MKKRPEDRAEVAEGGSPPKSEPDPATEWNSSAGQCELVPSWSKEYIDGLSQIFDEARTLSEERDIGPTGKARANALLLQSQKLKSEYLSKCPDGSKPSADSIPPGWFLPDEVKCTMPLCKAGWFVNGEEEKTCVRYGRCQSPSFQLLKTTGVASDGTSLLKVVPVSSNRGVRLGFRLRCDDRSCWAKLLAGYEEAECGFCPSEGIHRIQADDRVSEAGRLRIDLCEYDANRIEQLKGPANP